MHVVAIAMLILGSEPSPTLEDLVAEHESTVGLIYRLDVEYDVQRTSMDGKPDQPPILINTCRWSKFGSKERQRYQIASRGKIDDSSMRGDLFEDGSTLNVLLNWDPNVPLHPHKQGKLKAWFRPQATQTPTPFHNPAGQFALFQIQARPSDPRLTLRQAVEQAEMAELAGKANVRDHACWKIVLQIDDVSYQVFLDPKANNLIRKVVVRVKPGRAAPVSYLEFIREVEEFRDIGDGAFFPVVTYSATMVPTSKAPVIEMKAIATNAVVNEKLPSDSLDFKFPENAIVVNDVPQGGRRQSFVWGPDGKPLREITSINDLGPLPSDDISPGVPVNQLAVGSVIVGIAALTLVFWLRRTR